MAVCGRWNDEDMTILTKSTVSGPVPGMRWLLRHPVCWLGFGFGSGLAPKAPGTFGTLPALPLTWLLLQTGWPLPWLLWLVALLFVVGIPICSHTERALGRQDYGGIVWDEIVAMMLVLLLVAPGWLSWLLAFALFRLFDALKPWPIRWFDARVHGGLGIMLDDLIAAGFALLAWHAASALWLRW